MTIQRAGYVVIDDEAIWGCGASPGEAWKDFSVYMLSIGEKWSEDRFKLVPATQALLDRVETDGGSITWDTIEGVACVEREGDAPIMSSAEFVSAVETMDWTMRGLAKRLGRGHNATYRWATDLEIVPWDVAAWLRRCVLEAEANPPPVRAKRGYRRTKEGTPLRPRA